MEQCRQFKHLLNAVKKHSNEISLPSECFCQGKIKGYDFRLFQELNINKTNGIDDKHSACLCIKDKNAKGSMWSAFSDEVDLQEWVNGL
ncbi:MAG: hypothetical protein PF487_14585 [Bacteroidales bacterium]|jgi:hypothetical protein|nr:hypothetical protein [Bacteroidales bacterium]